MLSRAPIDPSLVERYGWKTSLDVATATRLQVCLLWLCLLFLTLPLTLPLTLALTLALTLPLTLALALTLALTLTLTLALTLTRRVWTTLR